MDQMKIAASRIKDSCHINKALSNFVKRCRDELNQFPEKGVPKIPTPSSAQIKRKVKMTNAIQMILKRRVFLPISSSTIPKENNKTPITRKSKTPQSTSLVKNIAVSGIVSKMTVIAAHFLMILIEIDIILMNRCSLK